MKQKQTNSNLRRFLPYYKPYKGLFIKDMLCATIVTAVELIFPLLVRRIMNEGLSGAAGISLNVIWQTGVLILILRLIDVFCNYYIACQGHIMGAKIETAMRSALFSHLQKLSYSYYDNTKIGHIMSRITNDLFEITEFSHHCPEEFYIAGVKIIGCLLYTSRCV